MKIIYKDGTVAECPPEEAQHVLRHTAAHIMAQAIQHLYPDADFAYGPATEKGFYYDVDFGDKKLTDEDLEAIEKEMKKIVKANLPIKPFILPRDEAIQLMHDRHAKYKEEHIGDLPEDAVISFYQQGDYIDMCVGPHLTYTKGLKAFKLTQQSGAYWKNDANNKMLTRINGVAFFSQEELDEYLKQQEEAKSRDHRKIGKEMGLFMTDELVGRGLPMFLPRGYTVWQELENYIKEKERKLGYQHVMTPCIGTVALYQTSGHWAHYKDNMFPAMEVDGESFVLRPMNCPHHMMIYANRPHSYRELPIRIGEIAHDFRYESSGTLKGIERGRHFCQNDAHGKTSYRYKFAVKRTQVYSVLSTTNGKIFAEQERISNELQRLQNLKVQNNHTHIIDFKTSRPFLWQASMIGMIMLLLVSNAYQFNNTSVNFYR